MPPRLSEMGTASTLARRGQITTMADLARSEQQRVKIGQCGGCGGNRYQGCSCDVCGIAGGVVQGGVAAAYAPGSGPGRHWGFGFAASPGCFPNGYNDKAAGSALAMEYPNMAEPYKDPWQDCINMDTLYSPVTSVGAATTVNVTVQPEAGCFLAFYYRLVVRDPVTGIQSVDWTYRRPRIQGCPIACDNIDRDIMGQFGMTVPEAGPCCCGLPLRAFIQRAAEALPLIVPVTNTSAAALDAQVEVRGFCCSTRIC